MSMLFHSIINTLQDNMLSDDDTNDVNRRNEREETVESSTSTTDSSGPETQVDSTTSKDIYISKHVYIVYSNKYNYNSPIFFPTAFKSNKTERIFNKLRLNNDNISHIYPTKEISQNDILKYHTPIYISKLNGDYISKIAGVPMALTMCPQRYIDTYIIDPLRWQCAGTVLAVEKAIRHGASINIGGGFNQAKRTRGAYNCIFSDIAIAVEKCCKDMTVAIVDLGSKMAEGFYEYVLSNDNLFMFDMFNKNDTPYIDTHKKVINTDISKFAIKDKIFNVLLDGGHMEQKVLGQYRVLNVPVKKLDPWNLTEQINNRRVCNHEYMRALKKLPIFLDIVKPDIVIYNACYDPYHLDYYGCMDVTKEGLIVRDLFVWKECIDRKISVTMTIGTSNSPNNYEVIGESVNEIVEHYPKFIKQNDIDNYYERLNNIL